MLRAAAEAGLAGFAFTEHIFHIEEARAASRYLGTRWEGELEGPPIGIERYGEIAAAAAAVPAVGVSVGIELEHWPDDPRVGEVQQSFMAEHAEAWDIVLGSVHCLSGDHSIFDSFIPLNAARPGTTTSSASPTPSRTGATTSSRTRTPRGEPAGAARHGAATRPPGRSGCRCRHGARGQRLGRAGLSELVQLLCESIARAGAPLSLGSDAHRPHSVGAVLRGIDGVRAAGVRSAVAFERRERRDYPL